MKKTLLNILLAAATFLFGVFTDGVIRFAQSLTQAAEAFVQFEKSQPLPNYLETFDGGQENAAKYSSYVVTPSGYYYSDREIKAVEKGRGDIIYLEIFLENSKIITAGSVYDGEIDYNHSEIVVSDKTFKLRTENVKGIEYKFEGEFLKSGFRNEFVFGEKVLKGTLQKFANGKKVKEIKSRFIFEYETCGSNGEG